MKNVSKSKTKHPCQMPLEVMKNIVSTLPENKTIFDPFMGSGTTALACIELGYDFIGCEINKEYYEIAKDRIGAIESQESKKIYCNYTDEEIGKSFIEDVEAVKDLLPKAESEKV